MKKSCLYFYLFFAFFASREKISAQCSTCTTFNANGTWTCPAGITSVTVQCWGGGGGGGGGALTKGSGGGGAGGSFAQSVVTVVPGNNYAIVVGAGGGGGAAGNNNGTAGGNSSFGGTTVVAVGGAAGGGAASGGGGTGGTGTSAGSTGTTLFAGGSGATATAGTSSGGGGGGAGSTAAGGSASGTTGGTGGATGGGNGGSGSGTNNTAGGAGSSVGGGGGGGRAGGASGSAEPGGTGAAGQVIVCYSVSSCISMSTGTTTIASCPYTASFYDSGGSGANYADNESFTRTFTAPAGSCLSVTFNSFSLEATYDFLYIYDGPTTGSTLLGTYSGSAPGTITSSGTSLTFKFTSDISNNYSGWDAIVVCSSGCTGTPAAGTASATSPSCPSSGSSTTLSLTGGASGCGVTYQWQSSPNNSTWTNITGATTVPYTATISGTMYYRCVTTCTGSGLSANSAASSAVTSAGPANNDCSGATVLTSGATCSATTGDVSCASQSQSGCSGTADDDIWFQFVAANTTEYVTVSASSSFDPVVQVFSGSCGSLTSVWCNDAAFTTGSSGSKAVTGLTVGNTYYVRVYDYYSGAPTTTTFSICITDPPSCPAGLGTGVTNVASLPYSVLGATTCGTVNNITAGGSAPATDVSSVCGGSGYYGSEDAVYTFTPTTTGVVTIVQSNTSGNVGFMLYSGCPFTGSCVTSAQNTDASRTVCLTLTAGTTYYLVVDSKAATGCYLYDLSISAPVSGTPAGTDCGSADPITSLPYSASGLTTCCKVNDYTSSNACSSVYMGGEDYVFSYTPAANTVIDVTLANTLAYTGVFITQGCPSVGSCVASNTNSSGNPSLCGISLTGGVTYYIIVDTDPNPTCTPFDISITEDQSATTCNLAYTASTITFDSSDPLSSGTLLSFPDDHFATAYTPIGFNFCFDGIQYSQLLVSSNAYLIFQSIYCTTNLPGANATPSSYSAWSISGAIPNTTNAPRNAILGPWHDIDPGVSGNIRYKTYGTSPNQRFVVSYDNVAMFDCNSTLFTGQIKLYETSNNIEVHLAAKNLCTTWNSGQAILGLHNYNGTIAVVPAGGYNAPTQWTATNKAWQFTTACPTCLTILPVDVTSFTGKKLDINSNQLNWNTSMEKNVKDFVVERSKDGSTFETVDVQHAKNSRTGTSYSYTDNIPDKNQTYYYRLISFDLNGQQKKSGLVVVERNNYVFAPFSLYPNPATTSFTLETEVNQASKVKIAVYDMLGKSVGEKSYDLENGFNALEFSIENYPAGMYYVKVVSADDTNKQLFVQKIVKQ